MRLTKISLIAAMLIGSTAFAIDNVKVSGNANLFYGSDETATTDLFDKVGAYGQASLGLGVTADLSDTVKAGAHLTVLSTLGLEGQLVNNVWEGTNGTTDYSWYDEAWMASTLGKTTVKVGRMELDTPLVFSEKWSVAKNTFESAVAINTDLPGTTIVGAYVGASNGGNVLAPVVIAPVNANGTSNFSQFYNGAYAFGLVNNSIESLTAQVWYYNATQVLNALWVQADLEISGLTIGAQYTSQDASAFSAAFEAQTAMALKVGYEIKDTVSIKAAYSSVDDAVGLGNVGANLAASGQSKLYTEAWWSYGYVSASDTTTMSVIVEAPTDIADIGLYYTMADNGALLDAGDLTEITLTLSKSIGALDASLAVINTQADGGDALNSVQAYLTYNF